MMSLEEKQAQLKQARNLILKNTRESLEKALDIYVHLLNNNMKSPVLHAAIARIYLSLGEPLMANIYAGEAVAFDRRNPEMYYLEAQTFDALGKYDLSAKCRRIAMELKNE